MAKIAIFAIFTPLRGPQGGQKWPVLGPPFWGVPGRAHEPPKALFSKKPYIWGFFYMVLEAPLRDPPGGGPKVAQKWLKNGPKMGQKPQIGPKMAKFYKKS